jgi:protein involved in polysaccharide export with SLBB domain
MEIMKLIGRGMAAAGIIFTCVLLAGCQSGTKPQNDGFGYNPLDTNSETAGMSPNSGLPGSDSKRPGPPAPAVGSDADSTTAVLQVGDTIGVVFNDLPQTVTAIQDQIKEDGTVVLYFNEKFVAAGKTVRKLQEEIHDRYVPKYYVRVTPSITILDRFYSVGGEVRSPNRYVWTPGMTVLRAIDTAGGFTDFSNKRKVIVTRANGKQEIEDCKKAVNKPQLDLTIYPNDKIFVKKEIL